MNKFLQADSELILPKLKSKSFRVVLTDPPYDLHDREKRSYHNNFIRLATDWVIVFSPPENLWIQPADQYLFWIKPISTKNTSRRYSRFVEMIFVYQINSDPVWNASRHWSQYTNVFTDLVDDSSMHPFRKPPSLIERLIRNHTKPGDRVLDPFAGSRVVGRVCELTNRKALLIDKNS